VSRWPFDSWNIVGSIRTTLIFVFLLVSFCGVAGQRTAGWPPVIFTSSLPLPKVLGSDHPLIETPYVARGLRPRCLAVVRFGLIVLAMGVAHPSTVSFNVPLDGGFSLNC